jgi:hypothetical protein
VSKGRRDSCGVKSIAVYGFQDPKFELCLFSMLHALCHERLLFLPNAAPALCL